MRTTLSLLLTLALLSTLLSALAGCESSQPDEELLYVPQTPLEFDPTEPLELGRWWSNGSRMLRLDDDGGYALYGGTNRYHAPVERGSWSRPRYSELRLAPYRSRGVEWERATIGREANQLLLYIEDEAPMLSIEFPPAVAEDRIVGAWRSPDVRLVLDQRGRFSYDPEAQGTVVATHPGRWYLDGIVIVCEPDVPSIPAFELRIASDNAGDIELQSGSTSFTREVVDRSNLPGT